MKRISQKYILYLILCLVAGGLWIIFCTGRKSVLNTSLSLVLGAYLLNLIFIFFGITFQMGGMIDLDVKDFKKIWWSRVFIFLVASALIAYLIVFRDTNTIKNIKDLINTAGFGILLGYFITRFDEHRKEKEEGKVLVNALLHEVSNSRFKCEAIIKGHPASCFEATVWDNLRLGKHFSILWDTENLTNKLFNLYLVLSGANWRINNVSVATVNSLTNYNPETKRILDNADKALKEHLEKDALPMILEVQTILQTLCRSL